MNEKYIARVVRVISPTKVVINAGENKKLETGDKFLIVRLGDTIKDPDTNENLGVLELVVGEAEITHLQERMATIESTNYISPKNKKRYQNNYGLFPTTVEEEVGPSIREPFDGAQEGDYILQAPQ